MKPLKLLEISMPLKFGDIEQIKINKENILRNQINKFIEGKKYYCPYCKNEFDLEVCDWWWHEGYLWIMPSVSSKCDDKCNQRAAQDDYEELSIKTDIRK